MAKKTHLSEKQVSAVALGTSLLDAQLITLRMTKCNSNIVYRKKVPSELVQEVEIGGGANVTKNTMHFDISVGLKGGGLKEQTHSIAISASYEMILKIPDNVVLSEQLHGEIGRRTGLNLVWPFWRELVNSITSRMGLSPLTIPLLRQDALADGNYIARSKKKAPKRSRAPR